VKSVLVIGTISNSDRDFRSSHDVVLPVSYTRIAKSWKAIRQATRRLSALRQIVHARDVFGSHCGKLTSTIFAPRCTRVRRLVES
jgi:hypothetical protein